MKEIEFKFVMLVAIATSLISCTAAPTNVPTVTVTVQPATFSDPFAYC